MRKISLVIIFVFIFLVVFFNQVSLSDSNKTMNVFKQVVMKNVEEYLYGVDKSEIKFYKGIGSKEKNSYFALLPYKNRIIVLKLFKFQLEYIDSDINKIEESDFSVYIDPDILFDQTEIIEVNASDKFREEYYLVNSVSFHSNRLPKFYYTGINEAILELIKLELYYNLMNYVHKDLISTYWPQTNFSFDFVIHKSLYIASLSYQGKLGGLYKIQAVLDDNESEPIIKVEYER